MGSDQEGRELLFNSLDFLGSPAHSSRVVDVSAGDGSRPIPGDFAMEPVEQLLVDMAMGGMEGGVDLVGVVSIPGHITSQLDDRNLRSYHHAQLEILMQVRSLKASPHPH
jgi:hypothetical protein